MILLLVMCLSYRYGGQSTPEHNYLPLQKSLCPQGKTKQRETVMAERWDIHAGVVFIIKLIRVVDNNKTVKPIEKQLHTKTIIIYSV